VSVAVLLLTTEAVMRVQETALVLRAGVEVLTGKT
jgi:hypothetical protein